MIAGVDVTTNGKHFGLRFHLLAGAHDRVRTDLELGRQVIRLGLPSGARSEGLEAFRYAVDNLLRPSTASCQSIGAGGANVRRSAPRLTRWSLLPINATVILDACDDASSVEVRRLFRRDRRRARPTQVAVSWMLEE